MTRRNWYPWGGFQCLCCAAGIGVVWAEPPPGASPAAVEAIAERAVPFTEASGLAPLIERLAPARVVLLGEASHGTSEFYTLRDEISRGLIRDHGFRFIVVEGDWNALYRLNRYVKHHPDAGENARAIMRSFSRWPTWMWANEETEALIEWLREFNAGREPAQRVGFYGMDVYGNEDALLDLPRFMESFDPERAAWLLEQYRCLMPFSSDFGGYARAVYGGMQACAEATREVVDTLRADRLELGLDPDDYLHLKQMAYVVKHAEKHYRAMAESGPASWNHRVDHFFQTVERLMAHYGPHARGIVWAHNTHIGDARATPMASGGQRNIGQMARQRWGQNDVAAVGFGTHRGAVIAGRGWGAPREIMAVPPAGPDTLEDYLHRARPGDFWLPLSDAPASLQTPVGHRAIGVIYHPENEFPGNYVPTLLPARYDAFVFVEESSALRPLHPD